MSSLLEQAYNPEEFRELGHQLVDFLADNLKQNIRGLRPKVIEYISPDENYIDWGQWENKDPIAFFQKILDNSIQLQHPRYMGHQVCFPAPLTALAGFHGLMLNSGGAIYEMSMAASTLEKLVIDRLKPYFGFPEGDGLLTSGGTLANLTALICARNVKAPEDVWTKGQQKKYAFMVSEEAHYCIDRAAKIMGWGEDGIIKVPVNKKYQLDVSCLEEYFTAAQQRGITVLGVVGSAPSTSTGIYDDLVSIGHFCEKYNLWFHLDAAHGGPAVFSEKYAYLMDGCGAADSIVVDAHKMMMTPSLTTLLLFKKTDDSYKTFAQKAQYLWADSGQEWYNYGKRTMECTKLMMSTRVYALINTYGVKIFEENIDRCYDNAKSLATMIQKENNMEVAVDPDSNIVCFRVLSDTPKKTNSLNENIRQKMLENGSFYIVQTLLHGQRYLRVSLMNPFTGDKECRFLLDTIQDMAKQF
ncbi:MAG: pyridoxal-dependent decarboxylase [Saprospiraceae bacterium]